MKGQARVVVIGGGIFGVSIAYHLAKLGWTDLILLKKDEIATGATGHAAGLVTQFATSQTLLRFRKYSIDLYSELGLFNHVGSLRVASSEAQLKEFQRNGGCGYTLQRNIALVYLPQHLAEIGTSLEIEIFGDQNGAEVAPAVLYDHKVNVCGYNC